VIDERRKQGCEQYETFRVGEGKRRRASKNSLFLLFGAALAPAPKSSAPPAEP